MGNLKKGYEKAKGSSRANAISKVHKVKKKQATDAKQASSKTKQKKTQTPAKVRKVNPSSRLAQSASTREVKDNRDMNAHLMAAQQAQVPVQAGPNGGSNTFESDLPQTIKNQMLQSPPTVAGNPAPQMNAAGAFRDQLLATMALQPMYHNPQQPGGVSAQTQYASDPTNQRQNDLVGYQAEASNAAMDQGIASPGQLREALMELVNYNGPVEGPPVTPMQQQAVNYGRGEQALHAGNYALNMKNRNSSENQRHTP